MLLEHWSNDALRYWDLFFGPIAFLSNLILLVLIVKHTTEAMKTFSVIIRMITICNCVSGFCRILLSRRLYPTDIIIAMFRGFCELVSDDFETRALFCHIWYTMETQLFMLSSILLMVSYIYRLRLITMPFDKFNRTTVHGLVYGYSLVHFVYFYWVHYMSIEPFSEINKALEIYRPELVNSTWTYFVIIHPEAPSQIVMTFASKSLTFITVVVAAICQWRLFVSMRNFAYSDSIKQLHREQIKILHAQTVEPLLTVASIFMFHATKQFYTSAFLENVTVMPMLLAYIVSPVVTIWVIKPYRIAFSAWFGFRPPAMVVVAPSSTLD